MKESIVWRLVDKILPSKEAFLKALKSKERLRFYFGIDPTSPDLHLGHAVALRFLRQMQILDHEIIILLGDFTARIGDPTGKDTARKPLLPKDIYQNIKNYRRQINLILPTKNTSNPAKILLNSKWLSRLNLSEIMRLAGHFTLQQFLERDMFQRRIQAKKPIFLPEFLYPLLQGYDSVALEADVEVGGADQLFNMLVGKKLSEVELGKNKFVITLRLLEDPKTGKKMSKSEGNYVSLGDSAENMYGKIMAFPDSMVWICFELLTSIPDSKIQSLQKQLSQGKNMRDIKAILAESIVSELYGIDRAKKAREEFERVFVKKLTPKVLPEINVKKGTKVFLPKFLVNCGLSPSRSESIRLIDAGAVSIDGKVIKDWKEPILLDKDSILQVGKKRFLKIRIK